MGLTHGGDLTSASREFGVPKAQWIDLSTGISPWSWPVPSVPEIVWQSLPDAGDGLEQEAVKYYGCDSSSVLAVSGSQEGLQKIPALIERGTVAIPVRGYEEHRLAWAKAGHEIVCYQDIGQLQQLVVTGQVKHAVVINPNNPTSEIVDCQQLTNIQRQLQEKGGWLLVDEAFMDMVPENSLVQECPKSGLVVLRSIGKFFGLAGLRLGFVIAPRELLRQLAAQLPPWNVSHPARWIGKQALVDTAWHKMQRQRLSFASDEWFRLLQKYFPMLQLSCSPLFVSGTGGIDSCEMIYGQLAQQGILVRLFDEIAGQSMVRFGLPKEDDMPKLNGVLAQVSRGLLFEKPTVCEKSREQLCTVG